MNKYFILLICLASLCTMPSCGGESASTADGSSVAESQNGTKSVAKDADSGKTAAVNSSKSLVNWVSIEDLEKNSASAKKKVMVDLYTDWCGWCKKMDKATFQHPKIADYLNKNFHAVKFNAEAKNNISFKGEEHKFVAAGRRGYNELAHKFTKGRMSYPTIAFLDEDLNRIDSYPGFKQAHQFDTYLRFIGEDHYKDKAYREFASSFRSDIEATPMPTSNRRPAVKSQRVKSTQ